MGSSNTSDLRRLADMHRSAVLAHLPSDRLERFLLFVEVVRSMDYWGIHMQIDAAARRVASHHVDLMYWGWNASVAELFEPLAQPNLFPVLESSPLTREIAVGLMQELGKASLLYRLADMGDRGMAEITMDGDEFVIQMSSNTRAQAADAAEASRLETAELRLRSGDTAWKIVSMDDALRFPDMPGAYGAKDEAPLKQWLRSDVDELIKPMVRPWTSGHGVMVAYDARIELDKHFMAQALEIAGVWRTSAGIHPNAKLGTITGADVAAVVACLVSLHLKHLRCVRVAANLFEKISVPQSLTIWSVRSELEESLVQITGLSEATVHAVFELVAMTSASARGMLGQSTPLIPLIFDLGNGLVLRPVASLTRNPFTAFSTQNCWVHPLGKDAIAADREAWLRGDLYAQFRGNRYICVPGNVKLRFRRVVLTDVDAVVYDSQTGDVGIFQLKWQDYATNDVRQLHSKASNLAAELSDWASKVQTWLEEHGLPALAQSLRIKQKPNQVIREVFLFAISKDVVRTRGYGVTPTTSNLAMAVWPQFVRTRLEVGPSARVLRDMHARLLKEQDEDVRVEPKPVSISISGHMLRIRDFWREDESLH